MAGGEWSLDHAKQLRPYVRFEAKVHWASVRLWIWSSNGSNQSDHELVGFVPASG
jgi:hypothetical protein